LLRSWRIHFRVIGLDVAAWGTEDESLISALHRLPQPTFFSLDRDFFRPDWAHASYGLVWLDVADDRAAEFVRRFLRHPAFDTQAKRMGRVVRVHDGGLRYWRLRESSPKSAAWGGH
jgi:hypothetical protein